VLGANFRCFHPALGFSFCLERAVVNHGGCCAGGLAIYNRALLGCGVANDVEVSERRLRECGDRKKSQGTRQDKILHLGFPSTVVTGTQRLTLFVSSSGVAFSRSLVNGHRQSVSKARSCVPAQDNSAGTNLVLGFLDFILWSCVMRKSTWTPSIVPGGDDHDVYLVLDDFGRNGRAWPETDVEATDLETVIVDLLEGQYKNPVRVVAFKTAEKWSQDVSADVAQELRRRCDLQMRDVPFYLQDFVDRYEGRYRDYQLPLPIRLV
jgi:hypothetical protein